ncbi:alpha/beta-Hydrolases superfamily protein [Zea mays]|uniref:Alpha/beta-Hydrolases superfamily protein n=1 Tax=Zea mays TaxID=4577 RepID=A0A1D6KGA2_MAIZE|nr:alpha/beta-Hydrolases superfamily protein [Zea mays]
MAADEGQVFNYCKLAQAAYAAYDDHNGTCRYSLADMLPAVGLGGSGYVATSFIYATVNILAGDGVNEGNDDDGCQHEQHWIGYVALATDAERDRVGYRDIAVVWRGTSALDELLKDLQAVLVPIHGEQQAGTVRVERGFESLYTSSCEACAMRTSARTQVLAELTRLVTYAFCDELVAGQRHVSVQRVIVDRDVVPTLPPTFFGYADAGTNVRLLSSGGSGRFPLPFLTLLEPLRFHSIKQYLRLLDPAPAPPQARAPVPADHLVPVPEAELDNMI